MYYKASYILLKAVSNLQPMVYRIYFLDGKTKAIALEPHQKVIDALLTIQDKIGLISIHGWALFEVRKIQSLNYLFFNNSQPQNVKLLPYYIICYFRYYSVVVATKGVVCLA